MEHIPDTLSLSLLMKLAADLPVQLETDFLVFGKSKISLFPPVLPPVWGSCGGDA